MLYDTHCHLNYCNEDELIDILNRAKTAGLRYIMNAGAKILEINRQIDICNKFSDKEIEIFCGIANHPENTCNNIVSADEIIKIINESKNNKIKAIGETGLDTHIPENIDFIKDQITSLENHIDAALHLKLPVIIHARGELAISKVIEILECYKKQNIKAVMHSYTGSIDKVKKILDIGCFISFSGIVTFKNANEVREIAKIVPIDRMFIETDAPFLAPVPMRGKTNETSFIKYTACFLSDFLEKNYDEFCEITTKNAKTFFNHE